MGLLRFVGFMVGITIIVVGIVWFLYPKDRPHLSREIFRGALGFIIMVVGLAILTSEVLYQPKSNFERAIVLILGALCISAISAAVIQVSWSKLRGKS